MKGICRLLLNKIFMKTKEYKNDETVMILGVEFHGVKEFIKCAREKKPHGGVYVGQDSMGYPCFDSYDYASENRSFWNFVFAKSEDELQKKLELLATVDDKGNYRKLHQDTPASLLPMAYWKGDTNDPLVISE